MSPSFAFSRSLRVIASDLPSSNASIATVVLFREPFGRPFGLPLVPGSKGGLAVFLLYLQQGLENF